MLPDMSKREKRAIEIENNGYIQDFLVRSKKVLPKIENEEMRALHQQFKENGNEAADSILTQYEQNLTALFMAEQRIYDDDNENLQLLCNEISDNNKDLVKAMSSEEQAVNFMKADSKFRDVLRSRYPTRS